MDILPLPTLYSFRRCPYAMRARLGLMAANQPVQLREIVLRAKPQAMIDASPKATVPVLILPDGTVIDESIDIIRWALANHDPLRWYEPKDRTQIDALITQNDGPFKAALDRYKYPSRFEAENIIASDQRDKAADIIAGYEQSLIEFKGGLIGDRHTLADYGILPFVRQFAHVDQDWFYSQPWPNVIAWLDGFKASTLFATIMEKYAPWQPADAPLRFPAA